jgi:protein arginine kinase activator
MLCEKCKKRDATVHLTEVIKNVKSEIHLCEYCAKEFGLNSKLSNFSLSVPDMLTFLDIEEVGDLEDTNVCATCGLTYMGYKKSGKLGCPDCYQYLKSALDSVIYSYHGESKHIGKVPLNYVDVESPRSILLEGTTDARGSSADITELKRRLESAVKEERYEDAARLRDIMIKMDWEKGE